MAPVGESYFPPLDKCFSGEYQLLSWKSAYIALSLQDNVAANDTLRQYFQDPQTLQILTHCFAPFPAPTPQTKTTLETKTSAINVSSSSKARYDIKQIQADVLWLSQEAKIDEVSSLRIAVIEWQTRPEAQLLQGTEDDQTLAKENMHGQPGSSIFDAGASLFMKSSFQKENTAKSEPIEGRRRRLLEIYLLERRFILKTNEFLLSSALYRVDIKNITKHGKGQNRIEWPQEIAADILSSWEADGADHSSRDYPLVSAFDALRKRQEALREGSGLYQAEGVQDDVEVAWARSQILEMIHIMQIALDLLQAASDLVKAAAILTWFRLVRDYQFFDEVSMINPTLYAAYGVPLLSLSTLVSLAMINLPSALSLFGQSLAIPTAAAPMDEVAPYLLNLSTVNELNEIFISVAQLDSASPAVMAWAILMSNLRDTALSTRESRETRQSLRAADRYGDGDSADTDGSEKSSARGRSSTQRRSSTGSDTSQQSTMLEEIYDTVSIVAVDGDPVLFLANNAVAKGRLFQVISAIAHEFCTPFGFEHNGMPGQTMRGLLLDLIRASLDFVEYQSPLITATIGVLSGSERFWETFDRPADFNKVEPSGTFLRDAYLKQKLFLVAMIQFPYVSMPFLQLCRTLALANDGAQGRPALWDILEDVDSFTCALPSKDYQAYVPIRTQEEADFIELTEPLNVSIHSDMKSFIRAPLTMSKLDRLPPTHEIPEGTTGRLMNDSKPFVVAWNQDYSVLKYMGKVLQSASTLPDLRDSSNNFVSAEIVGAVIGLFTNMMSAAYKASGYASGSDSASDAPSRILNNASDGLGRNQDVVSIIFDIFETQLYREHNGSENDESLNILVQCIQFTFVLLQVMPNRVWPFLGRSGLLGIGQDDDRLKVVIATQEMISGRYEFLLGCIRLYGSLFEDYVSTIVARKVPTKAVTRFGGSDSLSAGISQTTMERVLLSLTRTMVEVYESSSRRNFVAQVSRMEINFRLCSTFNRVLEVCFSVNDVQNISCKLTSALAASAQYLIDVFLSKSSNDVTILPIMQILFEGSMTRTTTLPIRGFEYSCAQVVAAVHLTSTLLKINGLLKYPPSQIEAQMFKAAPLLAQVYVAHENFKQPIVSLLDILVRSAAVASQQPPSLLGHLGWHTSTHFLQVLSSLDKPFQDPGLSTAIWRLLSTIVSKRQQWFAIFVLTGETPRQTFKDKAESTNASSQPTEPLLNTALDSLSNIDKLGPQKALDMLDFVVLAADYWPWVLGAIEKHNDFLKTISEYAARVGSIGGTPIENSNKDVNKISPDHNSIQMASYIANILSMYIRYTQQIGNERFAKMLVPHLSYLIKSAIATPHYNTSLHRNLSHNFQAKFPGCQLSDFKRTTLNRSQFGSSYFYDLELANQVLSYEPAWMGRRGSDGFAEEVKRANLNLSLVKAQINLFHGWKSLLIELSGPLATDNKFQRTMAVAATDCLKANCDNSLPDTIFERLTLSRANLAFTLLQRLLEVKSTEPEVLALLVVTWDTLRIYNSDLGSALGGESADYYRVLLRILCLALQFHSTSSKPTDTDASPSNGAARMPVAKSTTPIALEILSTIVAQGFRSLTIALHDSSSSTQPSDFILLTAILRCILQIPDITRNPTHLLDAFADSQTARCASTLFSWADQLVTSGDPIFGDISILFLLEMSSVPSLAESLAVEGVLSHLLSTNLIRLLQSRAFGPFDQPIRMYGIWARGILPLLLNLLHAVGPPLGAEIAAALNTFPHQLERASSSFASTSRDKSSQAHITLSMASEAATLSLIVTILQSFKEAGSSAGIESSAIEDVKWDRVQVKEDVEELLQKRDYLLDMIVPANEREESWIRENSLDESSDSEHKLEQKVVEELETILGILNGNDE